MASSLEQSHFGFIWSCGCALLVALTFGPAGRGTAQVSDGFIPFRCPQRDGVNCLYLQLRLLGYAGSYGQVVAALAGEHEYASLDELAKAARRLGFPLVAVKMRTAQLSRLGSPAVILSEELGKDSGRFHLLLGFASSMVHIVDGAFLTRNHVEMPVDQFQREWTGFALIVQQPSPWPARLLGAALVSMAAVIAVRFTRRIARWRKG